MTDRLPDVLKKNYVSIKEEFDAHKAEWTDISFSRTQGEWTSVSLKSVWGHWTKVAVEQFPTIYEIFKTVAPEVNFISINCLGPHSSIDWHTGVMYKAVSYRLLRNNQQQFRDMVVDPDLDVTIDSGHYKANRYHFGLDVPELPLLMGLECEGKIHRWKNGETFMFKDYERHRAWNDTDQPRYVLLYDVVD